MFSSARLRSAVTRALSPWHASLAGTTLLVPGTRLDRAWSLNPRAYAELSPVGKTAGTGFLLLAGVLALAAFGWFRRCLWGWRLTLALIATQVAGTLVNVFRGRVIEAYSESP